MITNKADNTQSIQPINSSSNFPRCSLIVQIQIPKMDDFGFLVQQYGIKPNSKSTPMAPIKPNANIHDSKSLYWDLDFGTQFVSGSSKFIESSNLVTKSLIDDDDESNDQWDALFQAPIKSSNNSGSVSSSGNGDFHLGSLLGGSQRVKSKPESFDLLDGFGPRNANESDAVEEWRVASVEMEDLLSSNTKVGDSIGDILGSLGTMESVTSIRSRDSGSRDCRKEEVDVDDLIPGCGETVVMDARRTQASSADNRVGVLLIEELGDPAIDRTTKNADSHVKQAVNMRNMHEQWAEDLIDMGEISGSGGTHAENEKVYTRKVDVDEVREMTNQSHSEVDLDSFFSGHSGISASSPERNADRKATPDVPDLFSQTSSGLEKKFPGLSFSDSISSTNVEGEDKERRNARFERYQKTEACMAQALADINQRDFQVQLEQEERHRIAETVDMEMKHWAAGKEGNLRALLSSLQQVLWAGCGWNPVSLADLITPYQVKMVYKKAALCVHPDKVQQRGASVQQKYIAEKVFHLLKEAWKKFSSEELR